MPGRIVYLPVEFRSREFDSKVLLATALVQRGIAAVIGQQWMFAANVERWPAGTVLFKSFNKLHQASMEQARRAGHRVVALEEESLAQVDERAVVALCAEGIFDAADLVLAHGQFEHDVFRRLGGGRGRIEICGNGRIDLLKPRFRPYFQAQADDLRRRHGDFVLVNTNFSILNSAWQSLEEVTAIQVRAGFLRPDDPRSVQTWQDYVEFEKANREAMYAAIAELARRRPAQKIVVRPHPGEDLRRWNGAFAQCRNVTILREGSHVPWTLACRLLLHTSCTTGFEARVAGRTALSLVPRPSWVSDSLLSNRVNAVFADARALVDAAEAALDGRPAASPDLAEAERYVWNCGDSDATTRIADLLAEDLSAAAPASIPGLLNVPLNEHQKAKFTVSLEECIAVFGRIGEVMAMGPPPEVCALGEGLFVVSPAHAAQKVAVAPPRPDRNQLRMAMEQAGKAGEFTRAYEIFKTNFGEAHRHADLCYFAGLALFELGKHALALQYFQHAAMAAGGAVDATIFGYLATCHHRLGDLELARRYAEQAYRQVPMDSGLFEFYRELAERTGKGRPEHWVVLGCSHARYFRYMQLNQLKYFDGAVHLECYEFAGATAYGLGNADSDSGALQATRQLRPRIAKADRVLVQFGEIDCRRAAWKAAAVSGRPIEETIRESAQQLEGYVEKEVLPHNRNVLLLGAKPQIIADEDFYQNSLEDERTVFQPLAERERITLVFNALLRQAAERHGIGYADIDRVLADEQGRRNFFRGAFWDSYSTDTHGNVDYFATLYFERLREFVGLGGKRRKP